MVDTNHTPPQASANEAQVGSVSNPQSVIGTVGVGVVLGIAVLGALALRLWDCSKSTQARLADVAQLNFMQRGVTEVDDTRVFDSDALVTVIDRKLGPAHAAAQKRPTRAQYRRRVCTRLPRVFLKELKLALARKHPALGLVFSPLHRQTIMSRSKALLVTIARILAAMCLGALFFGLDTGATLLESRVIVGVRSALMGIPLVLLLPILLKVSATATSSTVWLRVQDGKHLGMLAPKQLRGRRLSAVVSFRSMLWHSGLLTPGPRATGVIRDHSVSMRHEQQHWQNDGDEDGWTSFTLADTSNDLAVVPSSKQRNLERSAASLDETEAAESASEQLPGSNRRGHTNLDDADDVSFSGLAAMIGGEPHATSVLLQVYRVFAVTR